MKLDSAFEGPVLPAPGQAGSWMNRPVTSREASIWIQQLLTKMGCSSGGVQSHSLKATSLSWASKYGMSRHFRLQLGHHSAGDGSLNAYSRDLLAAPLRECTAMLGSIRHGAFNPDLTRSGRFSAVVKLEVHESEAEGADIEEPGRQLDDVVAEATVASGFRFLG